MRVNNLKQVCFIMGNTESSSEYSDYSDEEKILKKVSFTEENIVIENAITEEDITTVVKETTDRLLEQRQQGTSPVKRNNFANPKNISAELANFLHVPHNTQLSRAEVTMAIATYINWDKSKAARLKKEGDDLFMEKMGRWEYLNPEGNRRDLRDVKDKRIIVPDPPLSNLLNYEQYKANVAAGRITSRRRVDGERRVIVLNDDSLHYSTIQRLLAPHIY